VSLCGGRFALTENLQRQVTIPSSCLIGELDHTIALKPALLAHGDQHRALNASQQPVGFPVAIGILRDGQCALSNEGAFMRIPDAPVTNGSGKALIERDAARDK
jgi:hypothetical protein